MLDTHGTTGPLTPPYTYNPVPKVITSPRPYTAVRSHWDPTAASLPGAAASLSDKAGVPVVALHAASDDGGVRVHRGLGDSARVVSLKPVFGELEVATVASVNGRVAGLRLGLLAFDVTYSVRVDGAARLGGGKPTIYRTRVSERDFRARSITECE